MTAYIIDTETSQQEKPEVIELAWMQVGVSGLGELIEESSDSCRYKPTGPISCGARAVHHILDQELADCPPSSEVKLPPCDYIIGHNVDFDWEMLGKRDVKRICTLALARSIWTKVEGHALGACMYRISTNHELTRERLRNAHSAEHDVRFCYELLDHFLTKNLKNVTCMEDLWVICEAARVPTVWTFGKFKGKAIYEADKGYLNWCLKQADMDPYVKQACRQALAGDY